MYLLNLACSVVVIDLRKACILPIFISIGFWLVVCGQSLVIVSFLSASVAGSSCVDHVSPSWCISHCCGTQSTCRRVGHHWALVRALAHPCQECVSSVHHLVVHVVNLFWCTSSTICVCIPLVHLVPYLPNILSRLGFRKKLSLMSPPR